MFLSSSFIYVFGFLCLRMALVGADTCTELVKATIFTYNKCLVIDFILCLTETQTAFMCQKQTVKTDCYRQTNWTVQHENEKSYSDVTKNAFCWDVTLRSVTKFTTVSLHVRKFIPHLYSITPSWSCHKNHKSHQFKHIRKWMTQDLKNGDTAAIVIAKAYHKNK